MRPVNSCSMPSEALLQRYADAGDYTDCYRSEVRREVTLAQFVAAFYKTPVFRLERLVLRWLVNKPSIDADVDHLARGDGNDFAAWTVEDRKDDQLLLCDYRGSTRSWLMTAPREQDGDVRTRLYFGSAIVGRPRGADSQKQLGRSFRLLLGFHRVYSRVLLRAACARLERDRG